MRLTAIGLLPLFLVASCASSTRLVSERPDLARIPMTLREACRGVVDLPDRAITISEASRFWASDRQALGECARRHGSLVRSLEQIEGQGK